MLVFLMIHLAACVWLFIYSYDEETNWGNVDTQYIQAFYFITTTFAAVGYGDIVPVESEQLIYMMFVMLIGLALFSYFRSLMRNMASRKTAIRLIIEKKSKIEGFLNRINEARPKRPLPYEIYKESSENMEFIYKYKIHQVFLEGDFLHQMKPELAKELVFNVLKTLYIQFKEFFWEKNVNFQADDEFIFRILINLQCQVFLPGHIIISRGELLDKIYFIEKGEVLVKQSNDGEIIAELPTNSFFGDYQILMDTRSNVSFEAPQDEKVICYTIDKTLFLNLVSKYPDHQQFYTERALATRRIFKRARMILHK